MHPERRLALQVLLATLDALALAALWWVAPLVRAALISLWPLDLVPGEALLKTVDPELVRAPLLVVVPVWLAALAARGRYRRPEVVERLAHTATSALLALGGLLALLYLLKYPHLSRTLLVGFAAASVGVLALTRSVVTALARLPVGEPLRLALVGPQGALGSYEQDIGAHPEWHVAVAARVDGGEGVLARLEHLVAATAVDEVRLVAMRPDDRAVEGIAHLCAELGMSLTLDVAAWGRQPHRVDSAPGAVTFRFSPATTPGVRGKRVLDVAGALVGLGLLGPVLLVAMVLVRAIDGGPVLFVQTRAGLHGRPFRMLKLRTMVPDAEQQRLHLEPRNEVTGAAFKLRDDPRITPLGRVLRRWSIDELPQLVNVLRGEMSLVGPRPPLPDEVARYARWQRRRLSMRPGLTGLWQISGRSDLPFDQWMALDLAYLDAWSLARDLRILLATIPAVISGRGAR